jgi:hypothetical protein
MRRWGRCAGPVGLHAQRQVPHSGVLGGLGGVNHDKGGKSGHTCLGDHVDVRNDGPVHRRGAGQLRFGEVTAGPGHRQRPFPVGDTGQRRVTAAAEGHLDRAPGGHDLSGFVVADQGRVDRSP